MTTYESKKNLFIKMIINSHINFKEKEFSPYNFMFTSIGNNFIIEVIDFIFKNNFKPQEVLGVSNVLSMPMLTAFVGNNLGYGMVVDISNNGIFLNTDKIGFPYKNKAFYMSIFYSFDEFEKTQEFLRKKYNIEIIGGMTIYSENQDDIIKTVKEYGINIVTVFNNEECRYMRERFKYLRKDYE